jgi:hypothetical protein
MLIGSVVQHQFGDDAQTAAMGLAQEALEVFQRSVRGMNVGVAGDVVAVVAQRRWTEGQKPDGGDTEVFQVVELLSQSAKIADSVGNAVEEGADVNLIEDCVFVPSDIREQVHDLLPSKLLILGRRLSVFNSRWMWNLAQRLPRMF